MKNAVIWWLPVLAAATAGCGDDTMGAGGSGGGTGGTAGVQSSLYSGLDNWLCNPELSEAEDFCSVDLDATVVTADGETSLEPHVRAEAPTFDCFYVYASVSEDPGVFSDLEANEQERFIVFNQAALLSRHCRVFAPIYRQVTLFTTPTPEQMSQAYEDVLDAFEDYIANRNEGRGFVLVGHSQGTNHLIRLIAEEIEADPDLQERMISAYLLGGPSAIAADRTVEVPRGQDVGGSFASTPLCRSPDQFGCVVAYVSFLASNPPGADAVFGRATNPDNEVACVNPAALTGGRAILDLYFPIEVPGVLGSILGEVGPWADPSTQPPIETPFYKMPGFLEGECVVQGDLSYLALTVNADPSDPRRDDIPETVPNFGTHALDVNVAMGDILNLIESQAESWASAR